jgi:small conductance mechanosensitive channel
MQNFIDDVTDAEFAEKILAWLITSGLRIVLVVVIAFITIKLLYRLIDKLEARIAARSGAFDSALETGRRLTTVRNLLKHLVFIAIWGIGAMIILRELGVDIGPIIAGAGIMGLAVSFGAQNLVRDIISGFFMIMEDQVRVGDVAVVNGTGGTVEEINFRTIVIRDIEGTVHVFPNGTVTQLANRSKGWARYVVDINVSYKEDPDRVANVLKRVGEELAKDPLFGGFILDPIQILGVDNFGPNGYLIKSMIKTLPLKQWDVGRELRKRIKNKFEIEGIDLSSPPTNISVSELPKATRLEVDAPGDGPGADKKIPAA